MKALIISANNEYTKDVQNILTEKNCFPITYHSALKALDNIEEIAPDMLIINTGDFPRHWKTIIQYTQTLFPEKQVQIYLLTSDFFSKKEQEKAYHYDAHIVHSVEDFAAEFSTENTEKPAVQPVTTQNLTNRELLQTEENTKTIFLHNGKMNITIQGIIQSIDYPKITFLPVHEEDRKKLRFGQIFTNIEISLKNTKKVFRGQIQGLGKIIELCLL